MRGIHRERGERETCEIERDGCAKGGHGNENVNVNVDDDENKSKLGQRIL